jgi:hypothetical protein
MALEEQMVMNFGEVPDNTVGIDPVSGNEIPLGSSAKEVRDDIPAQLSEGEMVIPADVVRFFGVKFFEDLRQAAKIGYAKMDADGRIGGEPIPMEDMSGLGLEMTDLEVIEVDGDDSDEMMVESEEAFLGKFFAGLRESSKKDAQQSVRDRFQAAKERGTSSKDIKKRVQAKKDKPKNRYEEMRERMREIFGDDDDDRPSRPTVQRQPTKPATLDFGFRGNPMERGARKFGDKSDEQDAGQIEETYTGENLRSDESFGQRFMKGLGYDEGGDVVDPDTDVVQEGTTGGFGEEIGLDQGPFEGVMEAREYQNAAGHKIIIMFLDGEPMQDIPEGYYPVGSEPVTVDPGEQPAAARRDDDDDDGPTAPTPTPIDYQSLTVEELQNMVEDQKNIKHDAIAAGMGLVNPLLGLAVKGALWNQSRLTKKEIERRIDDPDVSEVDKMRLTNLLEIAEREEPSLASKLLGAVTGKEPTADIPSPKVPDFDVSDPTMAPDQGIAKAYTPEIKTPEATTGYSPEIMEQIEKASREAAEKAFSAYTPTPKEEEKDDKPGVTVAPDDNDDFIAAVKKDPTSFLPPTPTRDDDDDEPTFAPPPPAYTRPSQDPYAEPGRPTKTKRTGGGGRNKGGLMKNKKKKATNKKKK